MEEPETIELFLSEQTVKRLLDKWSHKFRRGRKEGFTFEKLAIPPANQPLPEGHDVALSRDRKILYINWDACRHLYEAGEISCKMGEKTLIHFYTEKYDPIEDHMKNFEVVPMAE